MSPEITKLPILILYPHNRCNCRCVMCDIWKTTDAREISLADLERHTADMVSLGVEWVIFSGGEPLMHSDLFALCRRLRGLGIRLTVLSTGITLAANARSLVEHVDEIIVSLDGPPRVHDGIRRVLGAFGTLAGGVSAVHRLRADFPVAGRCTIQKQNFLRLADTVEAARDMRLQSISFLAADVTSTAFNRPEPWPVDRQSEVTLSANDVAELEEAMEGLIRSHAGDSRPALSGRARRNYGVSSIISGRNSDRSSHKRPAATRPGSRPWSRPMAPCGRASFMSRSAT
jgi:MoaA/NifB/PqqE/SkfB family radical SAM enzyme